MAEQSPADSQGVGVTRRAVLGTGAGVAVATMLPLQSAAAQEISVSNETGTTLFVSTTVNGRAVALDIDSRASLLDLLRERLGFSGTKKAAITASAVHARCTSTAER